MNKNLNELQSCPNETNLFATSTCSTLNAKKRALTWKHSNKCNLVDNQSTGVAAHKLDVAWISMPTKPNPREIKS